MTQAQWVQPTSVEDALGLLADGDGLAFGGGVSLVLFQNVGFLGPVRFVSLAAIGDLRGIEVVGDELHIGAMQSHHSIASSPIVRRHAPSLARACHLVGNPRVRNWGTLGGNLAHADPAQDPPVILAALGAVADVRGAAGVRVVPVVDLAEGPLTPVFGEDEILTRIRVPLGRDLTTRYLKFLPGTEDDYATVSVAVAMRHRSDGSIDELRVCAGSVGPTVIDLTAAVEPALGTRADPEVLATLEERAAARVAPRSDRRGSADYKRAMTGLMVRRGIEACLHRSDEGAS